MHNIAHKTDKHTSHFVWGYLNPRMRTEIYFEQTGMCLFWRHLGKAESRRAMIFLQLLFVVRWSYLRISETRRRMKIFGDRGRAGKGCLRISRGEFRPNVVRIQGWNLFIHFFIVITRELKNNIEILEDNIRRFLVSWLRHSFQTVGNGGL